MYLARLAQHWARISCITLLLKYDQAVQEHVFMNTMSFVEATEMQELWLRIVMPDIIKAAARSQNGGGLLNRSGFHTGVGIASSCGYFQSTGCPHAIAQKGLPPANKTTCDFGAHECCKCMATSDDFDITCKKCYAVDRAANGGSHQQRAPPQQQRYQQRPQGQQRQQQQQASFALRPEAPPYQQGPQGTQPWQQRGPGPQGGGYSDGRNVKARTSGRNG